MSDLSIFGVEDDDDHYDRRRRESRRPSSGGAGKRGGIIALVIVLLLLGALAYGGKVVWGKLHPDTDYEGSGTGTVDVRVADGDTSRNIAATLVKADVVKTEKAFTEAAAADPRSRSLQPGLYRLRHQMSAAAALTLLLDPTARLSVKVTVPEGLSSNEIYRLVGAKMKINPRLLKDAAKNPQAVGVPAGPTSVEGFLFPTTYEIDPGTAPAEIIKMMVATFKDRVDTAALAKAGQPYGLNWYQMLTIASLTEEEAITPDFGKVARVVLNRLDENMALGFDSTINYVLDKPRIRLSEDDLQIDSPYNSYRVKGLPPTPIANPGDNAIQAASGPPTGTWLYFVKIDKTGNSYFTADYDDFLAKKAQAQANGVY